jgi:Tol biopolymer transport system component
VATQVAVLKAAYATLTAEAPTVTATAAPTSTPPPTATPAPTATATDTAMPTVTWTPTVISAADAWATALYLSQGTGTPPCPTDTPTPTPTRTPTRNVSRTPRPTNTPTPTPMMIRNFHHMILFTSDHPEKQGFWIMDPTGENRRYLGTRRAYYVQYEALREQERLSPDGRYRLLVKDAPPRTQIFVQQPRHPNYGDLPDHQLTTLTGLCYDPVWSPNGGLVAFVSQEHGSDDIWLIDVSGEGAMALTRNDWEWDKHPSWSADSRRIAFWSNRTGIKQIYVMDADGGNLRNISNTVWDEYDPVWIK